MESKHLTYLSLASFSIEDPNEIEQMIQHLKEEASFIDWNIKLHTFETLSGKQNSYISLDVPYEQYDEAYKIYEMYDQMNDIRGYTRESDFPGVYIYKKNKWILSHNVKDFLAAVHQLESLIDDAQEVPVNHTLSRLVRILAEIYSKAYKLPTGTLDMKNDMMSYPRTIGFSESQLIQSFLEHRIDLLELTDLINDVLESLCSFKYFILRDDTEEHELASMVYDLQRSFSKKYGWGEKVLNTLTLLHKINQD